GIERGGFTSQRLGESIEEPFGDFRVESPHQQLAGEIQTTPGYVLAGRRNVVELLQDGLGFFRRNRRQGSDLAADLLYIFFGKLLQQLRAGLLAQYDEQHGRLMKPCHPFVAVACSVEDHRPSSSSRIQVRKTWADTSGSAVIL